MSLAPGEQIGPYEVLAPLGAGGMGEVFRARDTRLKREVALKILPPPFAADPDRLARFRREAEVLAALNHPHIAQIYGLEGAAHDRQTLVMELVEGEDLAQRLIRGALPLDEALAIARQIADALEAAHDQGIVHRDLKPANVKVRPDGIVKILDFGLAKLHETGQAAARRPGVSNAPTVTSPALMTGAGVILGTAAYMSPEQARGKPADRRSDIWAFGCVLFEMLAGQRPFHGDEVTDVIVAVSREPDWTLLPSGVPPAIDLLIRRCLVKDPRNRLPHIGAARMEIDGVLQAPVAPAADRPGVRRQRSAEPAASRARRWAQPLMTLGVGFALGAGLVRFASSPPPAVPAAEVARLMLAPAPQHAISVSGFDRDLAVSPDGRRIAYIGGNGTAILVREIDRLEPIRIDVGGLPHQPFFSPDGTSIGFVDAMGILRRVSSSGGRAETISRMSRPDPALLPTWGDDDTIVFQSGAALWRVPAAGGTPALLLASDRDAGRTSPRMPHFLPGGTAILFTFTPPSNADASSETARTMIGLLDLTNGTTKVLLRDATNARYVSSGHLVYQSGISASDFFRRAGDTLRVIAFDMTRLETVGDPITLDEPVFITPNMGVPDFDVSRNGTFVYVPASIQPAARRLVWVDRDGREERIDLPVRAYTYPSISPSGDHVAIDVRDQDGDIWIWDLVRHTLRRLTFDRGVNQYPVWSPDGGRIVSMTPPTIRWQPADGSGTPETLARFLSVTAPYRLSPDGRTLVLRQDFPDTGHDLMRLNLSDRRIEPLLQTPMHELNADLSPDGRWLAYESDESGSSEIYVRPFPDVNAGRWQVSGGGGRAPVWSGTGRELFYLVGDGTIMSAAIDSGQTFASRTPVRLFSGSFYLGGGNSIGRTYDVAPDGRRFLMIKADGGPPIAIAVVLNWHEELRRLLPAGR